MKVQDPVSYRIRRDSILQKARHLFATKGFAEASMEDIAQTCDMQKASLYHYFSGKQQILQEMVDMEHERWSERLPEYAKGATLKDTLLIIGTTFLKELDDPSRREFFKILHFESHKNPSIFKAWKESPMQNREGFYAVFARHLENKLSSTNIAVFITQFMGALIHYVVLSKLRGENNCFGNFDETIYVKQLADTFAGSIHE